MGDPIFCKGCKAVLSKISKLEENKKKSENDESIKEKIQEEDEEESKENKDKVQNEKIAEEEEEVNGNMIW